MLWSRGNNRKKFELNAYIYADRHDRLCETFNEYSHRSFGLGKSGFPGNNDSGGLSSLFVRNTPGLYPVSGSGNMLIGAPQINSAEIFSLHNGKRLNIRAESGGADIYVDSVEFNGRAVTDYRITIKELMNCGSLYVKLK